ncbi:MAG TPA: hypothetical protein VFZ61_29565 [Polyangiales bacterium]
MEESGLNSLLSEPTWSQLEARLRDAVARDPANGPLVEVIRAPLVTLLQLWKDALPTLRGDPLAAERLRVTLQAASAAALLVPIARTLDENENGEVCLPGMLRLRLLAVLVLAAACAQREPALSRFASRVITGLALQCGPAEPLARLEPFGASPDVYDNLLRLSVPPSVAAGHASHIYRLSRESDPVERGRWTCIFEVIDTLEGNADLSPSEGEAAPDEPQVAFPVRGDLDLRTAPSTGGFGWSVAHADGIASVERTAADTIAISGSFDWWAPPKPFPADRVAVVGFTVDHRTVFGGVAQESTPERLIVRFDSADGGARPAEDVLWVGFVAKERAGRANVLRALVRERLERVMAVGCTAGEQDFDAAAVLPDYDVEAWPILEPPPRTPTNQLPQLPAGSAQPPEVPQEGVEGGARVPVVMLRIATLGDGESVPPSHEELGTDLQVLGRRLSSVFKLVTLPWVEDAGAVISSVPTDEDDPRVGGLLEMLSRAAARTPGRENALWVAVLPGSADVGVASTADAARGIGVATRHGLGRCIAEMLDARERDAAPQSAASDACRLDGASCRARAAPARSYARRLRAKATRLRVIGRLSPTSVQLLEPPREEERGAGHGAPADTGVFAVALDRAGAELARTPIRTQRACLPATFAALIPISPEVELVELRRGALVLARIERALDKPTAAELVQLEASEEGRVTATWTLPRSARPISLTVEISDRGEGDDWVPFTTLHACAEQELLPLWRSAGARRIRLVACDGWDAIAGAPVNLPSGVAFGPLVIRRVNERTLWADVPARAADVGWFTLVRHRGEGRRLDLTTRQNGEVRLSAMIGAGPPLSDSIELGAPDVYRRA